MRRVPAETPSSLMISNAPTSPVLSRWVPPQSSRLNVAHRDHADRVGILLAEEHHRARLRASASGSVFHLTGAPAATRSATSFSIAASLRASTGLRLREVEPQPVVVDLRALLLGVRAEVLLQGVVQNVRRRVGAADRVAAGVVDRRA